MQVNIELPAQLEQMVQSKVATGLYRDATDVVSEALRFMETHDEQLYHIKLEALRREVQIGIDQLGRGESVDGEGFIEALLAEGED
jgi:antitoxin ParD1/3/4